MKKTAIFELDIPPYYKHKILVYIGGTPGEFIDYCNGRFGAGFSAPYGLGNMYSVTRKDKTYEIIKLEGLNKTPESIATLMHEIQHVVFDVLEGVGIKTTAKDDEVFTYQCRYLFIQIYKKYFKK